MKTDDRPQQSKAKFPGDLLLWAGYRDGGVKKPFQKNSGRPAGKRIQTPLLARLNDWIDSLVKWDKVPTTILLVGGPGNGKTDAVDGLVEDLDAKLGLDGKLYDSFAAAYTGKSADNPPRRVDINLEDLIRDPESHLRRTISIVQDATEADPSREPGKSSQALILDELEEITHSHSDDIYICCVNRAKLAEAHTEAQGRASRGRTLELLTKITTAVTSSPEAQSCWPLDGFPSIVAWPMDIDSLVDPLDATGGETVLHQILQTALAEEDWPGECVAGDMCPFCTNRKLLSSAGALADR